MPRLWRFARNRAPMEPVGPRPMSGWTLHLLVIVMTGVPEQTSCQACASTVHLDSIHAVVATTYSSDYFPVQLQTAVSAATESSYSSTINQVPVVRRTRRPDILAQFLFLLLFLSSCIWHLPLDLACLPALPARLASTFHYHNNLPPYDPWLRAAVRAYTCQQMHKTRTLCNRLPR